MFAKGFPYVNEKIVNYVAAIMPAKTYNNVGAHVSDSYIDYYLGNAQLSFPYRLYTVEVEEALYIKLESLERMVLNCIYSRSCDGYVREKHIKALLSDDYPDWVIPYIVKVCDEYVVEILQTVYDHLRDVDSTIYKRFCADNRASFCKSYNRMISYWNEFYRDTCFRYEDYVGRKLFIECLGAKRTMNCSEQVKYGIFS